MTKQIVMNEYGDANVLFFADGAATPPQAGEVQLKVEAAGVNYSDILRRRNSYFMPTPVPYVLGAEAVGTITAVGAGVESPVHQAGSRVLAILPDGGGYAETVNAQVQYCVPLPPVLDSAESTALFVQGSTAHLMISQVAPDLAGKTVLIHAAAGGVGSLLVQLAKQAGAKVIATASSDEKLAAAQALGADSGVNYSSAEWPVEVVAASKGRVDVIFEMVGGHIFNNSFKCLKPGGTMIVYGAASGVQGTIESERLVDDNLNITSFNLAYYIENHIDLWQASLGAMIGLLAEGNITVTVENRYPLAEAARAHQDIEDRKTVGKVVLIP